MARECKKCGGTVTGPTCKLCELFATSSAPGGTGTTTWPMVSEALAVHPEQVAAANARAKRHGVNVVYDKKGFAHIPDRNERKKLLRLEGYHDKNGGFGD